MTNQEYVDKYKPWFQVLSAQPNNGAVWIDITTGNAVTDSSLAKAIEAAYTAVNAVIGVS